MPITLDGTSGIALTGNAGFSQTGNGQIIINAVIGVNSGGTGANSLTGIVKASGNTPFTAGVVNLSTEIGGILNVSSGGTGVTTATGTGSVVLANTANISNTTITALRETRVAMAANDVNLLIGNYFTKTISGTTTLTVSNVPASGTAASFILDLTNGGSATINWWTGTKWAGGTVPTLTTSGRDVLGFFTHDAGTTWTGLVLGKDVK